MRVFFKPGSTLYPKGGKRDDVVYCYHNEGTICFTRNYYTVPEMPQNRMIKELQSITLQIWKVLPLRFKTELSLYAKQYKKEYPHFRRKFISNYSIFLKITHKLDQLMQSSQNKTLSVEDFFKFFVSFSLADYIRIKFLPKVSNFYKLNAQLLIEFISFFFEYKTILTQNYPQNKQFSSPFG